MKVLNELQNWEACSTHIAFSQHSTNRRMYFACFLQLFHCCNQPHSTPQPPTLFLSPTFPFLWFSFNRLPILYHCCTNNFLPSSMAHINCCCRLHFPFTTLCRTYSESLESLFLLLEMKVHTKNYFSSINNFPFCYYFVVLCSSPLSHPDAAPSSSHKEQKKIKGIEKFFAKHFSLIHLSPLHGETGL